MKMLIRQIIRCPPVVAAFVVIGCPIFEGGRNAHFSLHGSPVITVQAQQTRQPSAMLLVSLRNNGRIDCSKTKTKKIQRKK